MNINNNNKLFCNVRKQRVLAAVLNTVVILHLRNYHSNAIQVISGETSLILIISIVESWI